MNAEEFALRAHEDVVEGNAALIRDLLETKCLEDATDPYWRDLIGFYIGLGPKQRLLLFNVMKQTSIDAISSALLVIEEEGESIDPSGFQDAFLAEDETRNRHG